MTALSYRETVSLFAPSAETDVDEHGQATAAHDYVGRSAARLVTEDRTAQSTPAADAITGSVQLELRTNHAIDVGWQVRWRNRPYHVRSVSNPEPLKQRVTLAPQ